MIIALSKINEILLKHTPNLHDYMQTIRVVLLIAFERFAFDSDDVVRQLAEIGENFERLKNVKSSLN